MTDQISYPEYHWSFAMDGSFKEQQVHPVSVEWERMGVTGTHHPCGAGHRFIVGRVYSNDYFRQLIEQPSGMWLDCMVMRLKTQPGLTILESRTVAPAKAAHVAAHYGIKLVDDQGQPIPFKDDKLSSGPVVAVSAPVVKAKRQVVGKTNYGREAFRAEFIANNPQLAEAFDEVVKIFDTYFDHWTVGENETFAAAYPSFFFQKVEHWPFVLRTTGEIEISFQWISKRAPWTDRSLINRWVDSMVKIFPRIQLLAVGRPRFPMSIFQDPKKLVAFKGAVALYLQITQGDVK